MTATTMSAEASRLVRLYYRYGALYMLAASIIWGINTLFLLDSGLSITEVFIANSAFSVGTMLFEIPTGVVADTIGRRFSFLLSLVVLAITTLLYVALAAVDGGVVLFSIVSMFMGLGFTFYSGAMEAWLVDGLRFHGYEGELDHIFSRGQMISGAAMLVGTVGGGLIGQIDLVWPFVLRSVLLGVLFVVAYRGMYDLGFEAVPVSLRDTPARAAAIGRDAVRFGWGRRSLRLLMVAGAVQSGFFAWAWYAWQPYFLELLERDAVWVAGVVAALLAGSMMIGNAIVEFVTRWCGRRSTLLMWSGSVFSLTMIGVGVVDGFVPALALLLLSGVSIGVQAPVRQAFLHEMVPTKQRATVVSFDSMIAGGGGVVGQTGLGALSGRRGFSVGYVLGGAVALVAVPIVWLIRRGNDPADAFTGTSATSRGSCAAQGIPAVANVESRIPADASQH